MIVFPIKESIVSDIGKMNDFQCNSMMNYLLIISDILNNKTTDNELINRYFEEFNQLKLFAHRIDTNNEDNNYILDEFYQFINHVKYEFLASNSIKDVLIRIILYYLDVCENISRIGAIDNKEYYGRNSNWIFTIDVINEQKYQYMIFLLYKIFGFVFDKDNRMGNQ